MKTQLNSPTLFRQLLVLMFVVLTACFSQELKAQDPGADSRMPDDSFMLSGNIPAKLFRPFSRKRFVKEIETLMYRNGYTESTFNTGDATIFMFAKSDLEKDLKYYDRLIHFAIACYVPNDNPDTVSNFTVKIFAKEKVDDFKDPHWSLLDKRTKRRLMAYGGAIVNDMKRKVNASMNLPTFSAVQK
jgi:hypothetical protein